MAATAVFACPLYTELDAVKLLVTDLGRTVSVTVMGDEIT